MFRLWNPPNFDSVFRAVSMVGRAVVVRGRVPWLSNFFFYYVFCFFVNVDVPLFVFVGTV